jgi:hypothetical protein
LDGRDRGQGKSGSSALYVAKSTNRGQSFEKSVRVALNVCPCCRPSIAFTDAKTMHIGWRGVLNDDIRDIFVGTSTDGGATFSTPTRVAEDNWRINGCPHSGPSLATMRRKLFTAWRTVTQDGSLSPLQRLGHAVNSATYPTLLFERPDHLFVVWTEGAEDGQKVVMARGRLTAPKPVNSQSPATGGDTPPIPTRRNNDKH